MFNKYFNYSIDYPDNIALNPLPLNVMYNYVSHSLLDGFINYVEIKKAFVLSHYYKWLDPVKHTVSIYKDNGKPTRKTFLNKDELYIALIKPEAVFHSECDIDFNDDVVILAKAGELTEGICYYYFYYDCDCSDCSISRFVVKDAEYILINNFIEHIKSFKFIDKPREIPLHYFRGWIRG